MSAEPSGQSVAHGMEAPAGPERTIVDGSGPSKSSALHAGGKALSLPQGPGLGSTNRRDEKNSGGERGRAASTGIMGTVRQRDELTEGKGAASSFFLGICFGDRGIGAGVWQPPLRET